MRHFSFCGLVIVLSFLLASRTAMAVGGCDYLLQLLMLPKFKLTDAQEAREKMVVQALLDRGVRFEQRRLNQGNFEFKIFPDRQTSLGLLAHELQSRGLDLNLSSAASVQQDAWVVYNQTFRVQMPLELISVTAGEIQLLVRVIEEGYDLQETRVLLTAMYNPSSLIKRSLSDRAPAVSYFAPVALTQQTRQSMRRQRRYQIGNNEETHELAHLYYVGSLLKDLRANVSNTTLHEEFAEALKGYLDATGVPVMIQKNSDDVTYDLKIVPLPPDEWKRREAQKTTPYGLLKAEYPELVKFAYQFSLHQQSIAWNTRDWAANGNVWKLTPFSKNFNVVADMTNTHDLLETSPKVIYLPIDEALREHPTPLTLTLLKERIKPEDSVQVTLSEGVFAQKVFVNLSVDRSVISEGRKSLRNLMALSSSYLPKDLHAIYRRHVEDLETALHVFGNRRDAMSELRDELISLTWITIKKKGDHLSILARDSREALRELTIKDPLLLKTMAENLKVNDESATNYVSGFLQKLKMDIDAYDDEVTEAKKMIEETKVYMRHVSEHLPAVYPGTFDWALKQNFVSKKVYLEQ